MHGDTAHHLCQLAKLTWTALPHSCPEENLKPHTSELLGVHNTTALKGWGTRGRTLDKQDLKRNPTQMWRIQAAKCTHSSRNQGNCGFSLGSLCLIVTRQRCGHVVRWRLRKSWLILVVKISCKAKVIQQVTCVLPNSTLGTKSISEALKRPQDPDC